MKESDLAKVAELTAEELIARGERMVTLGRELLGLAAQVGNSHVELSPHEERKLNPLGKPLSEQERQLNRYGESITEGVALQRASLLGRFTQAEFAEALGLKAPGTMRYIALLMGAEVLKREGVHYVCQVKPHLKTWVAARNGDGPFTCEEAARATGQTVEEAAEMLRRLAGEEVVESIEGELWQYLPPRGGALEHSTDTPPERWPPSYAEARATGMPVRIRTERADRRARSTPGSRQRIKQRDRAYERQEEAKSQRREAQKAKAQQTPKWKRNK